MSKIGSLYRAEYEFKPEAPSELGLQSGDLVRILGQYMLRFVNAIQRWRQHCLLFFPLFEQTTSQSIKDGSLSHGRAMKMMQAMCQWVRHQHCAIVPASDFVHPCCCRAAAAYITPVEEDNRAAAAPGPSPIAAEEGKHQAFETNRSSEAKEKPKPSPLTSAREEEVPDYGYESRDFPGFGGYEASSALNGSYDRSTAMNAYTSEADETLAIARANAFASRDPEIMDFEPASITK